MFYYPLHHSTNTSLNWSYYYYSKYYYLLYWSNVYPYISLFNILCVVPQQSAKYSSSISNRAQKGQSTKIDKSKIEQLKRLAEWQNEEYRLEVAKSREGELEENNSKEISEGIVEREKVEKFLNNYSKLRNNNAVVDQLREQGLLENLNAVQARVGVDPTSRILEFIGYDAFPEE